MFICESFGRGRIYSFCQSLKGTHDLKKDEGTKVKPKRHIIDYGNCTVLFTLPGLEDPGSPGELSAL